VAEISLAIEPRGAWRPRFRLLIANTLAALPAEASRSVRSNALWKVCPIPNNSERRGSYPYRVWCQEVKLALGPGSCVQYRRIKNPQIRVSTFAAIICEHCGSGPRHITSYDRPESIEQRGNGCLLCRNVYNEAAQFQKERDWKSVQDALRWETMTLVIWADLLEERGYEHLPALIRRLDRESLDASPAST
jgi:hypothetical protein